MTSNTISGDILAKMAATLGKRKRVATVHSASHESSSDDDEARARFQRAFEAKFKPLKTTAKPVTAVAKVKAEIPAEKVEDDLSGSDWSGFSGDEVEVEKSEGIEIVNHGVVLEDDDDEMRKAELKAFMVC